MVARHSGNFAIEMRHMSRNAGNDENGEFDDISPKTKIQANELKTRIPTKRRSRGIQRIWLIW